MNSKQRNLGYLVIGIIVSMIMYPAMSECYPSNRHCREIRNTYDWIFDMGTDYSINFGLLYTQVVPHSIFFLPFHQKGQSLYMKNLHH